MPAGMGIGIPGMPSILDMSILIVSRDGRFALGAGFFGMSMPGMPGMGFVGC
jgi:hypothetical protein